MSENTTTENPANNTITASESICPKGWTLPNVTQIRSIGPDSGSTTYISAFNPVLGGFYSNLNLTNETTHGYWWGSTAANGAARCGLYYNGSSLYTTYRNGRRNGDYIRCVQAP
ncbi:hypothetical protein IJI18_02990 [Candidatus Saccharibacteria bacterium]|nr:hypothetical protein [Candidatus Saccharibacteria bacterium]